MSLTDHLAEADRDIAALLAQARHAGIEADAPPEQPDPRTCCGRGCHPCMFSYYFAALDTWAARQRQRLAAVRRD